MKRNIKSVLKFFLLSAITVVFTVLLFRIFKSKQYPQHLFINRINGLEPIAPQDVVLVVDNEKIDWHDYEQIKSDSLRKVILCIFIGALIIQKIFLMKINYGASSSSQLLCQFLLCGSMWLMTKYLLSLIN